MTLEWRPWKSFVSRLEYRQDRSNKQPFLRGARPASRQETFGVETIFLF